MTRTTSVRRGLVAAVLAASTLLTSATSGSAASGDDPGLSQRIAPDQVIADDEAVLDQGHVDIGPRYEDGTWTLMVHDDTRPEGSVWRRLDRTVLRVADAAVQQVPDDEAYAFLGVDPGTPVHVMPQTQDTEVVWVGWNTQDPEVMASVDRGATLSLTGVTGPGHVVVYLQDGGFGAPDVLWDSRKGGSDQSFFVDVNTHTHANWVFSEPGTYLVEVEASATLVDGSEVADSQVLRFAVGDDTDPQEAMTATAKTSSGAAATTPGGDPEASATGDDGGVNVALVAGIAVAALVVAGLLVAVVVRGRSARRQGLDA
jgi:surface-anchored protein